MWTFQPDKGLSPLEGLPLEGASDEEFDEALDARVERFIDVEPDASPQKRAAAVRKLRDQAKAAFIETGLYKHTADKPEKEES